MAEVKWIKIVTNIFDDEKIQLIEKMPDGDAIIVVWFKLLCLAGKTNNHGVMILSDKIPYTDEMLSTIFRRPILTIRLALKTFESYGMIEIFDDVITITNWDKHQNVDGLDKIRNQTRLRVEKHRKRQNLIADGTCNVTCNATVTQCNATDIDKDIDKDIDNKENIREKTQISPATELCEQVWQSFITNCPSLPKPVSPTKWTSARKKAIKSKRITVDEFTNVFKKVEQSDFLTGRTGNWRCSFDWVLKPSNWQKISEGNYDNKRGDCGELTTNNEPHTGKCQEKSPQYGHIL